MRALPRPLGTLWVVVALAALSIGVEAPAAQAAYPGQNGLIAFTRWEPEGFGNVIYVMNIGGTGLKPLTGEGEFHEDYDPTWNPSGTKIAFGRTLAEQSEIWVMNADGTAETKLTNLVSVGTLSWSPDGTKIVFATGQLTSGIFNFELYVINADGTGLTRLTTTTTWETNPSWSPDGSKIAFELGSVIHLMDPDGSDVTSTAISGTQMDWSPNAQQFAYVSQGRVRVANINGSSDLAVSPGPADEFPAWSPDGARILFTKNSTTGTTSDIMRVNPDGTGLINLTPTTVLENYPNWGPCPSAGCSTLPVDSAKPSSTITRPRNGVSYFQANLTAIQGTATDTGGSSVSKVQIALRRYLTDGRCANWDGSQFVIGACNLRLWRAASGTVAWAYQLPRVLTKSKGTTIDHYLVMSRGIDAANNIESLLTDGRNRNTFEIV